MVLDPLTFGLTPDEIARIQRDGKFLEDALDRVVLPNLRDMARHIPDRTGDILVARAEQLLTDVREFRATVGAGGYPGQQVRRGLKSRAKPLTPTQERVRAFAIQCATDAEGTVHCERCGRALLPWEIEICHIVARSHGGAYTSDNLYVGCNYCHMSVDHRQRFAVIPAPVNDDQRELMERYQAASRLQAGAETGR